MVLAPVLGNNTDLFQKWDSTFTSRILFVLTLPEVEKYLPTPTGAPHSGNAVDWAWNETKEKVVPVRLIDEKVFL